MTEDQAVKASPSTWKRDPKLGVPSEEHEQITLAQWLDAHPWILWCHVPNGSFKGKAAAGRFKALGLKSGVPDILLFTMPPNFTWVPDALAPLAVGIPSRIPPVGVAIELKRQRATHSAVASNQLEWGRRLSLAGWYFIVARGAGEAIAELERLGYWKR